MLLFQRKLKLRGPDRSIVTCGPIVEEYEDAMEIGRVRLGSTHLFYRDLGKKYYVPYDYIERSFTRISECQPDDSPAYYYYRLILVHDGKEFANLIFNHEEDVDRIHHFLQEKHPSIAYGYVPPPGGENPKFM